MIDVIFALIGLLRRGNLSLHDGKWWSTILPANQTWRLENPYMIFPSLETPSSLGDFQLPAIFDDTRHGLRVGCIRNHWLVWKSCIHVYPKINCWTHWVQLWPLTVIYIFLKKTPQTKFIYAYIYIYIYVHIIISPFKTVTWAILKCFFGPLIIIIRYILRYINPW